MNRLWAAAVLLILPVSVRAQGFEGIVKMRTISVNPGALEQLGAANPEQVFDLPLDRILALRTQATDDAPAEVTIKDEQVLSIKGSMIRSDQSTGTSAAESWYMIIDMDRGRWLAVQPGLRRYSELTEGDMRSPAAAPARAATRSGQRARPLGTTKTVAGFRSNGYEVRSESKITRGWMAGDQQLVAVVRAMQRLFAPFREVPDADDEVDPDELLLPHGFPMLTQTLEVSEEGEIGSYEVEEVLSVDRKPIAASLFAVPAGFQKVTMEQLFAEAIR